MDAYRTAPAADHLTVAKELLARGGSMTVHVNPARPGVVMPGRIKRTEQVILTFSRASHPDVAVGAEGLAGTFNFAGTSTFCRVPWHAVFSLTGPGAAGAFWEGIAPMKGDKPAAPALRPDSKEARAMKPLPVATDAETALSLAVMEASRLRHERVTLAHVLYALLHQEPLAALVARAGADPVVVRTELESHLSKLDARAPVGAKAGVSSELQRAIRRSTVRAQSASQERVTAAGLLVSIFVERESPAAVILEKCGATQLNVTSHLARAVADAQTIATSASVTPHGSAEVIFHNNDYATMELVVDILQRFFDKSDVEATTLMIAIHKTGTASVGVYEHAVAQKKSQEAVGYANAKGLPLVVTLVPPSSG